MRLTDQGLEEIEQYASKKKNANILLMIQVLKEVRELKALLNIHQDAGNCRDDGSGCANDSEYKHG